MFQPRTLIPAVILALCFQMAILLYPCRVTANSSANVPLNHWAYAALDKICGYGLIQSDIKGMRPYSRSEVARLVCEAQNIKEERRITVPLYIDHLIKRLREEFLDEVSIKIANQKPSGLFIKPIDQIELKYIYSHGQRRNLNGFDFYYDPPGFWGYNPQKTKANEGTPLVQNNEGVIYGQDHNATLQFSSRLEWGRWFSAYVEPMALLRENKNDLDDVKNADLILYKGYVKINPWKFEILAGRDSIWWGQGRHGTLLLSDNAAPFDMIKISTPEAMHLPGKLSRLGPWKIGLFYAQLEADRYISNPTLFGARLSIKPLPILELGATASILGQGAGQSRWSLEQLSRLIFKFGRNPSKTSGEDDPGDKQFSVDWRLRMPFLWNAEFYGEYAGEDEVGQLFEGNFRTEYVFGDLAILCGLYLPRISPSGRTDLRLEFAQTSNWYEDNTWSYWYSHGRYKSGNTYKGLIYGHHMGGDAVDYFGRITHAFNYNLLVGLDLDVMQRGVADYLSPVIETVTQIGTDVSYDFKDNMNISLRCGYEKVKNYDMNQGVNKDSYLLSVSYQYRF